MVRSQELAAGHELVVDLAPSPQVVTVAESDGVGSAGWPTYSVGARGRRGSLGTVVAVAVFVGTQVDDLKVAGLIGLLAVMVEWLAAHQPVFVTQIRVSAALGTRRLNQGDPGIDGSRVDVPNPRHSRES
ncbi:MULTISPECIES: hypothetical protein [Micromonospora]|uniref:Uncharacterized protein n=1 Tax=Micromonospora inaquosa TaxID=2203716 RepID=A0A3N9X3U0_9ACTN|nr:MULTISPECIES: hypothetical protein [Micromonospora]RQX07701.1 hypothetical protein DLJ59_02595 [Micromonospora inaquosa]